MVLKQLKPRWWVLTSDDGQLKLTWFGESRDEVLDKFRAYIRDLEMDRIRCVPKRLWR